MPGTILTMKLLKENYGVCRLGQGEAVPAWVMTSSFYSMTKTEDELSVVCDMALIPDDILCERDWRVLKIEGPLDFALVGILSLISKVLADCSVSIFAVSTYDTDYILVKEKDRELAITSLKEAMYEVVNET